MKNRKLILRLVSPAAIAIILGSLIGCGGGSPATQSTTAATQPGQTGSTTVTTAKTTTTSAAAKTTTGKTTQAQTIFKDAALDAVIRDALGKYNEAITCSDVADINLLGGDRGGYLQMGGAHEGNIKDLTGIECCTNATQINLDDNQVTDITPVSKLTQLKRLWLWHNQISDITPIKNLTELRGLAVGSNVQDISPVAGLILINDLTVNGPFTDLSPIAKLADLTNLEIKDTKDSDIRVLATLTKLSRVYLDGCPITDIKPLVDNAGLQGGTMVSLTGCPLDDKSKNEYIPALQKRGVLVIGP